MTSVDQHRESDTVLETKQNVHYTEIQKESGNVKEEAEQETIEFLGNEWNFVKERLFTDSKVYRSIDGLKYLHIGKSENINSEALCVKKLHGLGFPVPEMLDQGESQGYSYYIERSLVGKSFRDKFRDECALQGGVNPNSLESFCDMMCLFLRAQIKTSNHFDKRDNQLRINVMLSNVLQENPDLDIGQVESCVQKIESRILTLPKVFSHGDLTPRNTFGNGIIDFEFRSIAPIGYDVLTAPVVERFWGFKTHDRKTHEEFYLDEEQVSYYLRKIEKEAESHRIKDFLKFSDDFILLKAVWSLAYEKHPAEQSGDTTKWNFRKKILIYCMKRYLSGEPIETKEFGRLNVK